MEFQEFRVGDYFEVIKVRGINKKELTPGTEYDYVTRTIYNQGILQTTGKTKGDLQPAHTFSVGLLQFSIFYRDREWYAGQFVRCIKPRIDLSMNLMLYFLTILEKNIKLFQGELIRTFDDNFENLTITLPSKNNQPDWEYMEKYIEECKTEYVNLETEYVNLEYKTAYQFLNGANPAADPGEPQEGYQDFRVGDILNLDSTKKSIHKRMIKDFNGDYPYVTRNTKPQGIDSFINYDVEYLNPENTISLGLDTFVLYYQDKPYFTGNKVLVVSIKDHDLTNNIAIYLITVLRKKFSNYTWSNGINRKQINDLTISLPSKNNQPDWEYMDSYIEECKQEQQNKINQTAYNLLNGANPAADPGEPEEGYQDFRVGDVLEISTIPQVPAKFYWEQYKQKDGIPYLTQKRYNNGLQGYIKKNNEININKGNCITIGPDNGPETLYYQPNIFYANKLFRLDNNVLNENIAQYLITMLKKHLQAFNYTDKINIKNLSDTIITLPSKNNQPDWEYMDSYIQFIKNGQSDDPDKQSVLQQMKLQNENHVKDLENLIN